MAKIIYGLSGEGLGHSSRASEVITHLQSQGHEVRAVSYDRGYRNIRGLCEVVETEGLHIISEDNEVRPLKTFFENLKNSPKFLKSAAKIKDLCFDEFQPDCVFTDFEPTTAYLAWQTGLPLVSIDNQHRMRYMDNPTIEGLENDARITRIIIRGMVPRPDIALITTFYFGKLTRPYAFAFPPILRKAVLDTKPSEGDHVLVYLSFGFETFMEKLPAFPEEKFVVYGYDRDQTEGNVRFRPFSKQNFLEDLASAKAVIATAGFTLMTEALHFRKPYLAMPMAGQFEQELNGTLLASLDYGMNDRSPSKKSVREFLRRIPEYREKLKQYRATDNSALMAKIDELLADDCALLKEMRRDDARS